MNIDFSFYRTKVFIDSNVVLEARPLRDINWADIDPDGPIIVMMAPTVFKEVDAKKKDGRLGQRARDFNRMVAPMISATSPVRLRDEKPIVDIAPATVRKIDWNSFDDLDRTQGDDCLVAEILNVNGISRDEIVIASQDLNPLFMAKRHGLKTFHLPVSWLPDPEPSPQEKELAKLRRQVAEYAKTEPAFSIELDVPKDVMKIYRVGSLSSAEIDEVVHKILSRNSKVAQTTSGPLGMHQYDYSYNSRYEEFEKKVQLFASTLRDRLELMYGQVPFVLRIENVGKVTAENFYVEVRAVGGWVNNKPIVSAVPPVAPRLEPFSPTHNLIHRGAEVHPPTGRHEVEVDNFKRAERFNAQCLAFRQGQNWTQSGVVWIDPSSDSPTKLVIKVTAGNFHGEYSQVFSIEKIVQDADPWQLLDRATLKRISDTNVEDLINQAIERKAYDALDVDGR